MKRGVDKASIYCLQTCKTMARTNKSKLNTSDKTTNNKNIIILGEFLVDSDGEVYIDPANPIQGLRNASRLQMIRDIQRKLRKHPLPKTHLLISKNPQRERIAYSVFHMT
jgi:hypothetical protein